MIKISKDLVERIVDYFKRQALRGDPWAKDILRQMEREGVLR